MGEGVRTRLLRATILGVRATEAQLAVTLSDRFLYATYRDLNPF